MSEITTDIADVGRLVAPAMRATLGMLGMPYVEHRDWPQSHFVISGTAVQWRQLIDWEAQAGIV